MYKGLEIRLRNRPCRGRKPILVVVDCNSSIYWTLARIANLAVKQKDFLMYLNDDKSA